MSIEIYSFLIAAFFLSITPGPSVLYISAISLRFGVITGIISILGVNLGSYVLILIATFGLYPILDSLPFFIETIQILGGTYMIYLADRVRPKQKLSDHNVTIEDNISRKKIFIQGFITTLLNPKDILFYILFIPNFIPSETEAIDFSISFLILSCSYALIGLLTKISFALFSGVTRSFFSKNNSSIVNYASALVLFSLGLYSLFTAIRSL